MIKRINVDVRNYLLSGSFTSAHTIVNSRDCCASKETGGLGLIDPHDAFNALLARWVMRAFVSDNSNLQYLFHYKLSRAKPCEYSKWSTLPF